MKLKHGLQRKLAAKCKISPQQMNDVIKGRKKCPAYLAVKLEDASMDVLGVLVPARVWIEANIKTIGGEYGVS